MFPLPANAFACQLACSQAPPGGCGAWRRAWVPASSVARRVGRHCARVAACRSRWISGDPVVQRGGAGVEGDRLVRPGGSYAASQVIRARCSGRVWIARKVLRPKSCAAGLRFPPFGFPLSRSSRSMASAVMSSGLVVPHQRNAQSPSDPHGRGGRFPRRATAAGPA